jgi:hypothetical protein
MFLNKTATMTNTHTVLATQLQNPPQICTQATLSYAPNHLYKRPTNGSMDCGPNISGVLDFHLRISSTFFARLNVIFGMKTPETYSIPRECGRMYTGLFISPSGISDLCGTVTGMVTPKGNMSTEGETPQFPSFCPTLQVLDISTLGDAADVKFGNFGKFQDTERFFIPCPRHVSSRLPP